MSVEEEAQDTNPIIEPVAIPVAKKNVDPGSYLTIEVSPDALHAYAIVDTLGLDFSQVNPTAIYSYLSSTNLADDLLQFNKITEIMNTLKRIQNGDLKEVIVKVEVASGQPVVLGEDGWVKFYHPHNQRVVIRDDGKADYRNLEKYISIKQGDKILTLFQGVPGKPGRDVYGTVLNPPAIKRPKVVIGANINSETIVKPEEPEKIYVEYYSALDGVLFSTDESINVSQELRISSNIGLTTGNVNYNGTITVEGSIEEGSKVACNGSLYVSENVESFDIQVGTDLIVKGGIKLKGSGVIKVKGNVRAKFLENVHIQVDGDVIVEASILNSKVYCLGSIILTGQTSSVIGSEIVVYGGLSTVNLGSAAGLDVPINMGIHFKNERLFHEVAVAIKASEKELGEIIPKVQQMNNIIKQSRGKIDVERKKKFKELIELYQKKNDFHKKLLEKYEELKTTRFNQERTTLITKGAAYPGVTIKYRRQVEKISVQQTAFMMTFFPGQDHAPMTAINVSTPKKK
jgi:uncharacterized protein (DUF342 family)